MNLNNLENLKEELKALAFKDKVISEIVQHMEKGIPENLPSMTMLQVPGDRYRSFSITDI